MVEYEDITADAGPLTGGIAVEAARPTLQARVTALENAFKSILKTLDEYGDAMRLTAKAVKELQKEIGVNPPPENNLQLDVEQARVL